MFICWVPIFVVFNDIVIILMHHENHMYQELSELWGLTPLSAIF
jgi:hypothetical protein